MNLIAKMLVGAALLFYITPAHPDNYYIDLGPTQVATSELTGWNINMTARFEKIDFTIGWISEQDITFCSRPDCRWELREQLFAGAEIVIPIGERLRLGVGPYWFQNWDRAGSSNFRAGLSVEWRINEYFGIKARHWSSGGSGPEREYCRDKWGCFRQDYNTGQDRWLGAVFYF